ncbi:MAG TPA: hypothetical protein VH475_00020 [Tepidisphaeraceae bacterium]|jgi:hypothetical protein
MNTRIDYLSERVAEWTAQVEFTGQPTATGELALQGWALCEELRRRSLVDPASQSLIQSIEGRMGPMPTSGITAAIERAAASFGNLLNDLDREEENLEHVRRQMPDVFFSVLEALILADESGEPDAKAAADRLFNTIVRDLYVFEPMADTAAELQRLEKGDIRLCDLLCAGVAGLFDGQIHPRQAAEQSQAVEEFVPLAVWLQRQSHDARQRLTLAAFAQRLSTMPAWYVKWSTQRVRLVVELNLRELRAFVVEGEDAATAIPSRGLDGWQFRLAEGRDARAATIKDGQCAMPLPAGLDPARVSVQVKDPAAADWTDLFARVPVQ